MPLLLEISVYDDKVGGAGISIPGIPVWSTLDPSKNLAICTTDLTGATRCFPEGLERSRCPRTERCIYTVETAGAPIAVSVFNIANFGKDTADFVLKQIARRSADSSVADDARHANRRRAFWRASFIIDDATLTQAQRDTLEQTARNAIVGIAFPGSADPVAGPLAGPFGFCSHDGYGSFTCESLRQTTVVAVAASVN